MQPDWSAGDETVALLQRLIRFNTTNPPGNEGEAAKFLVSLFESEGIEARMYEAAPGRSQVVARIKGTGVKRPVMLLAHMDVVGVEREAGAATRSMESCATVISTGGGAIDDKGMLAANLMTMLLLKRRIANEK